MKIINALWKASLWIAMLALIVPILYLQYYLDGGCSEIESIARDGEAVAYLNQWVYTNVLDKGYMSVNGMNGPIVAKLNDKYIEIEPLPDESKSRIDNQYLRFSIDTLDDYSETPVSSANVAQIDIGSGRNQIILLKNGSSLSAYRGHDIESGHLLKINDSTYAYCADSTF